MAATTKRKQRKTPLAKEAAALAREQRDKLADVGADVMHALYRSWSIDTLLSHPHDAIRVARETAKRLNRSCTEQFVHELCRALLNARKHGDLKRDPV